MEHCESDRECEAYRTECAALHKALADAQATVEALQAQHKYLCQFVWGEEGTFTFPDGDTIEIRKGQSREQLEQQLTQRTAEVEALQREIAYANECRTADASMTDQLKMELDAEREKVTQLDAMYRQQLGDRDKRIGDLAGAAKIWMERYTQLQALVRALPVLPEPDLHLDEVWARLKRGNIGIDLILSLLRYRATLDAATPAAGEQ